MTLPTISGSQNVGLVRGLGLLAATAILIGDVIGSGVFLKARVMTCNVETPGLVVLVWIVAGLLSLTGALTYAELSAMMPRAGGEYVFIRQAYGPLLGFLYGWTRFWVASTGAMAGLAAGFAIFINVVTNGMLGELSVDAGTGRLAPLGDRTSGRRNCRVLVVTTLNCAAIAFSGRVASAFTVLKIALVLTVGVGAHAAGGRILDTLRAVERRRRMRRGSCCGTRWGRRLRRGDARRAVGLQRLERGHLRGGGGEGPAA